MDSVSTAIARPMRGVFRGPSPRLPPGYIDTPPDEDRNEPSLQLWFVDEKGETGRIGENLEIEYDGEFESGIETTIDEAVVNAEPGPVDFNCLSVRLFTDVELRRLVHVTS